MQNESLVCYANGPEQSQRPPPNIAGWYFPAPYGIYAVRDGHVAISLGSLKSLSKAISLPALNKFNSVDVFEKKKEIAALIQSAVKHFDTAELESILEKEKLWYARINDYKAVLSDPQVQHNGSFLHVKSAEQTPITLLAHPVKYDGERPGMRLPPQPLGSQTMEILKEIGYSEERIKKLSKTGVLHVA